MFKIVATIAALTLAISASVDGFVKDTDLRITGGRCDQPTRDACIGMSTRGGRSERLFKKLGRTKSELETKGWKLLNRNAPCAHSGKFNGYRWVRDHAQGERISHTILLDTNGIIAGMQYLMPYDEVDSRSELRYSYDQQLVMQNLTYEGVEYYYITVYFLDPKLICTTGRRNSDLQSEGTVKELYIQTGPSPRHVKQLALKNPPNGHEENLMEGWNQNNCFGYMGHHRFYMQETWDTDRCATFLPFFLMYDNDGDLNGFGFLVPGKASSPSVEIPPLNLLKWTTGTNNGTHEVPKCLERVHQALGISSLHVFLTNKPYEFQCPDRNSGRLYANEWQSRRHGENTDRQDEYASVEDQEESNESSEDSGITSAPKRYALKFINLLIDILHTTSNWISSK